MYATFYYVGKFFGIRGKSEHEQLMADQFRLRIDSMGCYVEFSERRVKTSHGELSQKLCETRVIQHYQVAGEKFVYSVIEKYLTEIQPD